MRRNESDFSSKLLHRHRCLPINNLPSLFYLVESTLLPKTSERNINCKGQYAGGNFLTKSLYGSPYNILVSASSRHLRQNP
jgi:hypothetical protein